MSSGLDGPSQTDLRLFCRPFLTPGSATALADVVVRTGGVGVCYTNLQHGVPSLVVPLQPEQETNGIHLERVGCGRVLRTGLVFMGDSRQYQRAISADRVVAAVAEMLAAPGGRNGALQQVRQQLQACRTRETVLDRVRGLV